MIRDQIGQGQSLKRHAHGDGNCSHRQQLDIALHFHFAHRRGSLHGRQMHHLRAIKQMLPRRALAGIDGHLLHRLAQKLPDAFALHVIGDVEGVDINDFP